MEWIEKLRGSTVGLDTGPLIYYIEEHSIFHPKVKPFFEAAERNEFRLVTWFDTLIEVLVHPLREGRPDFSKEYRNILLQSPALTAIPLDVGIAGEAAGLRARHNLRNNRCDTGCDSHPLRRFLVSHERWRLWEFA